MMVPQLVIWWRLAVVVTGLWLSLVALSSFSDAMFPGLHSWLTFRGTTAQDPLGLMQHHRWARIAAVGLVPPAVLWVLGLGCAWASLAFARMTNDKYVKDGRLADVLALIQHVGLHKKAHRSEAGLQQEAGPAPLSAPDWITVAREHPEFFRVNPASEFGVSLIARHVTRLRPTAYGQSDDLELEQEYVSGLMSLAVELHDRQERRMQTWQAFIPIMVGLIAGVVSIVGVLLQR